MGRIIRESLKNMDPDLGPEGGYSSYVCCITNNPKHSGLKLQPFFSWLMVLWVRSLSRAWLGDTPVPCGIDGLHSMVFSWQMDGFEV